MPPKKFGRDMTREDIIGMSVRDLRRFHIVDKVLEKRMSQKAAAGLLELSERQVRRLVCSVREAGARGIIHRGRGRPSNRRHPEVVKERVLSLYGRKYRDFGPTLASEKLLELEGLNVSRETLRQWLLSATPGQYNIMVKLKDIYDLEGPWSNAGSINIWRCGDVNDDNSINILDVVMLINYKYKSGPEPNPIESGDVNDDNTINILDIVTLINYKYKSGPPPNCP
jgi:transposase